MKAYHSVDTHQACSTEPSFGFIGLLDAAIVLGEDCHGGIDFEEIYIRSDRTNRNETNSEKVSFFDFGNTISTFIKRKLQ